MEQYEISRRSYLKIFQRILEIHKPEAVFVRFIGSIGRGRVLSEDLTNKKLELRKSRGGIKILINSEERFFYKDWKPNANRGQAWSLAYFRTNERGVHHVASTGYPNLREPRVTGPDDPQLPPVRKTILRSANSEYLIEITFPIKIPIRNTSKLVNTIPGWYYWEPIFE